MQTMQERMTAQIEAALTDGGLDAVVQTEWANTGTIFGMKGMTSHIAIRYQFNDSYCTFALSGPCVEATHGSNGDVEINQRYRDGVAKWMLYYKESAKVANFFGWLVNVASCW